jgi:hypothetical protein
MEAVVYQMPTAIAHEACVAKVRSALRLRIFDRRLAIRSSSYTPRMGRPGKLGTPSGGYLPKLFLRQRVFVCVASSVVAVGGQNVKEHVRFAAGC